MVTISQKTAMAPYNQTKTHKDVICAKMLNSRSSFQASFG